MVFVVELLVVELLVVDDFVVEETVVDFLLLVPSVVGSESEVAEAVRGAFMLVG